MRRLIGVLCGFVVFSVNGYSQNINIERDKGLQFNVQTFAMAVGNADEVDTTPEEHFMHVRNSRLYGVNFEAHYRFEETWTVGLGIGYETIRNPDIEYIPLYLSLRSALGSGLKTPVFRLDLGMHFGDLAKNGALLRTGIGYRLPVYKELCLNLEGIISYQGIRKEFDSYPEEIQYYNMFGFGIGAGLEL